MTETIKNIWNSFATKVDDLTFDRDCALPGVHFPNAEIFTSAEAGEMLRDMTGSSSAQIVKLSAQLPGHLNKIHGLEITAANMEEIYKFYVDAFVTNKHMLPRDYRHFGSDDAKKLLVAFLKSNPFFASALKARLDEHGKAVFEVKSVDDEPTWFSRYIATYHAAFPRVNVAFDDKFSIVSLQVLHFDEAQKKHVAQTTSVDEQEACSRLLFLLTYYFEVVHTTIHVLHVLLISALVDSTRDTRNLKSFAAQYAPNVYLKFKEVKALLLAKGKVLTGDIFHGNYDTLLPILAEMLKQWGSFTTADEFVRRFLLKDLLSVEGGSNTLAKSNVLTQFLKHAELISPFAQELDAVFQQDRSEYTTSVSQLQRFLENTGENGPRVKTLRAWIELMGITGILHGATISATRLAISAPVLKLFKEKAVEDKIEEEKKKKSWLPGIVKEKVKEVRKEDELYGKLDTKLDLSPGMEFKVINVALGTIVGLIDEHEVFTTLMAHDNDREDRNKHPIVRAVETKYAGRSAALKLDYYQTILQDPEFAELGWVWMDYAPDMLDCRQFTIATYV